MFVARLCLIATVIVGGGLCAAGMIAGAAQVPQLVLVPVAWLLIVGVRKKFRGSGWVFGTARVADHADLLRAGYFGPRGLLVGCVTPLPLRLGIAMLFKLPWWASEGAVRAFFDAMGKRPQWVRVNRGTHCLIVAPTGAGKGAGIIVPTLMTDPGNFVVLDPKGELFKITAAHRRRMGQEVVVIDPWRMVTQKPHSFNPLSRINATSPTSIDDLRALSAALVVRTGEEREPHWNDSAEGFIGAAAAFVSAGATPEERNLQSVVATLSDPNELAIAIKALVASGDPILQRIGGQLGYFEGKERGGVLTTTNRHLRFLSTPAVMESTSSTSFNPGKLVTGKMTVYLVMPTQYLASHSGLLRMWVSGLMSEFTRAGQTERHRCTFLLDEAASLGHMNVIDNAITQLRGYGLRLCLVYQAVSQLKECFPNGQDQTVLANMDTQVYFGTKDYATAEYISKRIGNSTVENWSESGGSSTSTSIDGEGRQSTSRSRNDGHNVAEVQRPQLFPDEVIGLDERTAIVFAPGCVPIFSRLVRYYERGFKKALNTFGWRQRMVLIARAIAACVMTVGLAALLVAAAEKQYRLAPVKLPQSTFPTRR